MGEDFMREWSKVLLAAAIAAGVAGVAPPQRPLSAAQDSGAVLLARDGYFYVNARTAMAGGKSYVTDQMYVEERIPANRTHPYPIIRVHGGTMSGTNFTGTPDGRDGWAQFFLRRG